MKMSKRAETAHKKVLEHWERLVACNTLDEVFMEWYKTGSCAFCKLYFKGNDPYPLYSCSPKCPVKQKTGSDLCRGTPYDNFSNHVGDAKGQIITFDKKEYKRYTRRMLNFLKKL